MSSKAILVGNTGFSLFNFRLPLMAHLSRHGWSVVAVANDESDYSSKFGQLGFRFINVFIDHKGTNPIRDLSFSLRLRSLYEQESPDLVHHFTIKPVIFGSLAAKLANVPAIVNSMEGLGYAFMGDGWLRRLVMVLYKLSFLGRPKVIFLNKENYSLFASKGIIRKDQAYIILGAGVNTREIYPAARDNDSKIKFVLISRMLWSKGVAEFVKSAEKVKKFFPEASFTMAGGASGGGATGNPHAIPDEWLHNVNESGNVQWVGRVPFEHVMSLVDQCSVFVLPSYYPEGIPMSLLEAAAKGKAIITTDTPGCREVVEDGVNGFLVPPKDVNALEERMIEFIRNPDLVNRMGKESRRRAEDLFDEQKILEQTADVFRDAGVPIK